MNGYLLPLTCPKCGLTLEHVNASKVTAESAACAVAACEPCRTEWSVHVQVRQMPRSSRFAA